MVACSSDTSTPAGRAGEDGAGARTGAGVGLAAGGGATGPEFPETVGFKSIKMRLVNIIYRKCIK